ncbi:hypothetical protein ACTFIU_009037 [Dictyostelium citrinum]
MDALLHKTLVLCKMFGLARLSDLVKWSFNALKVTADSIKGPVINAKEQRNTKSSDISVLELTSLEAANLSVCPERHLATYLRSSSKKRNAKSGDSVFIHADGTPLQVDDINKVVISTLSKSNNFNGSAGSVASGGNTSKSASVWKELGLPSFCQEVVSGLKVHVLPNFKSMHNPIPISIPEGPKSECITKEVQDLLVDDAIEPNQYSKLVFYSNVFTVPKPESTSSSSRFKKVKYFHRKPIIQDGRNQEPTFNGKARLLHVDPHYRDLFRFVWKGVHYRWKKMPFGLSTAPRIFTMLLRPVLRMLRELNVSVIAYLDDLLIVGATKEECLSNLDKTMKLLVKLGFKLNLEKSVLEPTQSITFLGLQIDSVSMQLLVPKEKKKSVIKEIRNFLKLDNCTPRKLAGLKGKLIALKDAVIPFRLYTRKTNKFHCHCLSLSNGDWDQSFVIPQDVKSEIRNLNN